MGNIGPYDKIISFFGGSNVNASQGLTNSNDSHTHTITAIGGTETRPKNVALIYIIKSK